jgi:hypothetical protein
MPGLASKTGTASGIVGSPNWEDDESRAGT